MEENNKKMEEAQRKLVRNSASVYIDKGTNIYTCLFPVRPNKRIMYV